MKKPLRVAIAVLLAVVAASHPAIAQGQGQGGGSIQGPTITKLRGLVILIDFSDKPANVTVTRANQIINGVGYTEATVTRSLRDYWFAQSRGRVELTHEIVGYYRAPQTAAWYQARTFNEYITLVRSALDWTVANRPNLDWNGLSLASGPMNRNGTEEGTFLSINFLTTAWIPGTGGTHWLLGWTAPNGVPTQQIVGATFISPWDTNVNLFWMAHELGHSIWGWPDLYDTTGLSHGTGRYSVMSGNQYTGDIEPVGAPLLLKEGWLWPLAISATQTVVLIPDGPIAARYDNPADPREYFVIEARRKSTIGNSAFPVTLGLLIWHVDERVTTGNTHPERTPANHYLMSIEQADGRYDLEDLTNSGDSGDIYIPGRTFTALTTPDSDWWDGSASLLSVTDVQFLSDGTISFRGTVAPLTSTSPNLTRGSEKQRGDAHSVRNARTGDAAAARAAGMMAAKNAQIASDSAPAPSASGSQIWTP